MKLKFTLFCFALAIFSTAVFAQSTFQRSIDFGGDDYANQVGIYNGNCFMIGSTNAAGAGSFDAQLIKTDFLGNVVFQKQLGGSSTEYGTKLKVSTSGKIVAIGRSNSFSTPANQDFFVFQCDENGTIEWSTVFGTDSLEYALAISETPDNGYIIAGQTKPNDKYDVLLVKISSTGTVEWEKILGNDVTNEGVYEVKALGNNGYVLFGYSGINTIGLNEGMIMITDTAGNLSATFLLGGSGDDDIRQIADGTSGTFYAGGSTRSFGAGQGDIFLAKFDVSSMPPALVWFKTYGGTGDDSFSSIVQDGNNYLISGGTQSFGNGDEGISFKVNDYGDVIWAGTYGNTSYERIQHLINNSLGGYLAVGYSTSFGGVANNVYLINSDSLGNSGCNFTPISLSGVSQNATFVDTITTGFYSSIPSDFGVRNATVLQNQGTANNNVLCMTSYGEAISPATGMTIFPNPARERVYLSSQNIEPTEVKIFNSTGQVVFTFYPDNVNGVSSVDVSDLSPGIYQVETTTSGKRFLSRFAIER